MGGWGGWGGMITYLALAHTLAEHIPCVHGWVGWVGWDDHVPCTCTHPSRTHRLYSWVGTTPVLLRTTKYYSGPVLLQYYKVILVPLRYYSVLQSTTPVLLCTTKYYSSTTPVLHSNTPVPPQYYTVILQYHPGTTPYYKVLLRSSTTPVLQSSTSTKQCACRE